MIHAHASPISLVLGHQWATVHAKPGGDPACMQGPEEKETAVRKAPATRTTPSAALLIEGFKRPFTDKAAAALLSEHGEPGSTHSLCSAKEPRLVTPHIHLPGAYQQGLHGLTDKKHAAACSQISLEC